MMFRVGVRKWGGDGSGHAFHFFPFPVQKEDKGVMMQTWRKTDLQTCEKTNRSNLLACLLRTLMRKAGTDTVMEDGRD